MTKGEHTNERTIPSATLLCEGIIIGKKNNQSSVSDADREVRTLGSTDNAGNSVNLVSDIIRSPSGWDFSICIDDRFYLSYAHFSVQEG